MATYRTVGSFKHISMIAATVGVTLPGLLLVITLAALLVVIAVPSFVRTVDRHRLKGVALGLVADLDSARAEALRRNTQIYITFYENGETNWCYGLDEQPACDCHETDPSADRACALDRPGAGASLRRVGSADHPRVRLLQVNFGNGRLGTGFEPRRGTVIGTCDGRCSGFVVFASPAGEQARIQLGDSGRVSLCSDSGILGFPACR